MSKTKYTIEPADPDGRWLIPEGSRNPQEWEWIPDAEDIVRAFFDCGDESVWGETEETLS